MPQKVAAAVVADAVVDAVNEMTASTALALLAIDWIRCPHRRHVEVGVLQCGGILLS